MKRLKLFLCIALLFAPVLFAQQGYIPFATEFDGSADYYTRADLSGNADGKLGTFSLWFRVDGTDDTLLYFTQNSNNDFRISRVATEEIQIFGRDTSDDTAIDIRTTATYATSTMWHHLMGSFDTANGLSHLYVDDSSDNNEVTNTDLAIDYTSGPWAIGATVSGTSLFNGAISEYYFAQEYLDFSVESNRRFFITADGKPVDLGPGCYKPTGTVPIVCLQTQFNGFGQNSGSGGDFTPQDPVTSTTGPVAIAQSIGTATSAYPHTNATEFDGSADFYLRGGDLTGASDSKKLLVSFWFRVDGGDGTTRRIIVSDNILARVTLLGNNKMQVALDEPGSAIRVNANSDTAFPAGEGWHHFMSSLDVNGADTGNLYIYVDGVDDLAASPTFLDDTLDFTDTDWGVGGQTSGANKFNGALAEIYFAPGQTLALDANGHFFITADLKPVDLGPGCSTPTGTAAIICLTNQFNAFGTNEGTGGDFIPQDPTSWTAGPVPIEILPGRAARVQGRGRGVRARR